MKRKRAEPRLAGTACIGGKRCIATETYKERRYCMKHLADRLFAEHTREACDGACWAENASGIRCNGGLQCAHLISRRYAATRWLDANAMPLCAAHHLYFTHHPLEWEAFCIGSGVDWDELRSTALYGPPMQPIFVIERLKAAS